MADPFSHPPPHSRTLTGGGVTPPSSGGSTTVPDRIDRFEVREVLGRGGFGFVVRAFDPMTGREVAIKMPHAHLVADPEARGRFVQEAQAAGRLEHPNICPVYDVREAAGVPFIVMKFVRGRTMHGLLADARTQGKRLPAKQACQLVRMIAAAVDFAHNRGIIHRDLKPANILIDAERKQPVVTDFGLARLAGGAAMVSSATGASLGTPAYMSKELWEGAKEAIGPHTDVYALGVMLYECLTGRWPYDATMPHEFYARMLSPDPKFAPPKPSALRGSLDPRLDDVVMRAIRTDHTARYPTAKEFADAIGGFLRVLDDAPRSDPPSSVPPRSEVPPDPEQVALESDLRGYEAAWRRAGHPAAFLAATVPARLTAWRKAAEGGHPGGMVLVGGCLNHGLCVPADPRAALTWFRKAADAGYADGMKCLGWMYANGRGVPQNDAEAAKWYKKAADAGDATGMKNLAWMHHEGRGVRRDDAEAVRWFCQSAAAGHADGMFGLGWMYQEGAGVPQSDGEAIRWFRKAAEAGNPRAMFILGGMYLLGRGGSGGEGEAVRWLREAAFAPQG